MLVVVEIKRWICGIDKTLTIFQAGHVIKCNTHPTKKDALDCAVEKPVRATITVTIETEEK
jgi:hypothetical protein